MSHLDRLANRRDTRIVMVQIDDPTANLTDDDNIVGEGTLTKLFRMALTMLVIALSVLLFPIAIFFSVKVIKQYEKAVVFRLGRLTKSNPRGPGMLLVIPLLDKMKVVDTRTQTYDIHQQNVLTNDLVTIDVNTVLFCKVFDPVKSVVNVVDVQISTIVLAATTLRNVMASVSLSDFLSQRETLCSEMESVLDAETKKWGLKVESLVITDVRLPAQMQRDMAAETEADYKARAKMIASQGEQMASEKGG